MHHNSAAVVDLVDVLQRQAMVEVDMTHNKVPLVD
jgi:hypothetical protein